MAHGAARARSARWARGRGLGNSDLKNVEVKEGFGERFFSLHHYSQIYR